ncbi:serine/threonine protein kinase, partial [Streptomyces sp. NPDC048279]
AALLGGGAAVALQKWDFGQRQDDGGSVVSPATSGSSSQGATTAPGGTIPAGWKKYDDPVGFTLYLPAGWKRSVSIKKTDGLEQIDYSPDGGTHLVRVAVDTSPDYTNAYDHMRNLERRLRERLVDYTTVSLKKDAYRDLPSSRWEYTWTALAKDAKVPGSYRAVDVGYFTSDGVEYAIYTASPADDWATTSKQFTSVLQGWREGEVAP